MLLCIHQNDWHFNNGQKKIETEFDFNNNVN